VEVSSPRITEWKDNKETLNDEDDDEAFDEVDDEDDDNVTTITYKDLFRMATLGGATGTVTVIMDVSRLSVERRSPLSPPVDIV